MRFIVRLLSWIINSRKNTAFRWKGQGEPNLLLVLI